MKKVLNFHFVALALLVVSLISCSNDDDIAEYSSLKGAFVVCQGDFYSNNGVVSYYGEDGTVDKDIYSSVNGTSIGDIVQDFEVVDTLGFIVVNNSQKVEIVGMNNFISVATIDDEDLSYPRYVVQASDNTVYISNGAYNGQVFVYNFESFEIVDEINVGNGPEMMAKVGTKVYVANSGGWTTDNTISVIDVETGEVTDTITVGYSPVTLKADDEDNIWVYCKGTYDDSWSYTSAAIYKINTSTDEIAQSYSLTGTVSTYGSNLLAISSDGDVYYTLDGTYKMGIDDTELPTEKWSESIYYGIDVDPETGEVYGLDSDNNQVEILDATDATVNSTLSNTYSYPHMVYFNY